MYEKFTKILLWVLMIVGIALAVWGYASNFDAEGQQVDLLLYWAYGMVVLGVACAIIIGLVISIANNPKSLITLAGVLLGCAVVVGLSYVLASGDPLLSYTGPQPTETTLKLTDTILNLTYLACGAAVLAVIIGSIVNAVRSK